MLELLQEVFPVQPSLYFVLQAEEGKVEALPEERLTSSNDNRH